MLRPSRRDLRLRSLHLHTAFMIVISLLFDHAPGALANHRRYARMNGYRHVEIDMSELSGGTAHALWTFKYETLLQWIDRTAPGEAIMLLTQNAAILGTMPLLELLEGRDWLLTCVESPHPQTDLQVWRNTEDVRCKLYRLVTHCRFSVELPEQEGLLLREFDALPPCSKIGGVFAALPAAVALESVWAKWPAFSVCIREEPQHRRFRAALFAHINACLARGLPFLSFFDAGTDDTSAQSVYQPGQPIAIVTLYTPNIARYGRIAEANSRRYCARHGYTLYVHRDIPAHLNDGKTAGNWLKPALLREYLPHHEWVFWVDADVLINDMNRRLESIMNGQDALFARDVGTWTFNSGIMGFRRTQPNYDAFHHILHACSQLDDKSSVYANRGDQYFFIDEYEKHADFDATRIASFIEWNTPWIYRRADSFMVHYIGMWEDNKALLMDYDVTQSAIE
ncbi:hypothetical protein P9239_00780 [Caballeronia sp. LZ062]|uniref:hypothetical protein n=1 Tax=unclassified Caballeronia TaxID=2646786 RepID=UPI0028602B15|nr:MULTISPECIES: hypothetical protein [unclassified Caballeronia]MDR5857341.1 hypothetical protein [Caballeronia sp. LZ050]MDR5868892.1 hypothetical protein [Caballeronia sp. LZ062]